MTLADRLWAAFGFLFMVAVFIVAATGWVMNIVHLMADTGLTFWAGAARIVGIFVVPVGAILGYL